MDKLISKESLKSVMSKRIEGRSDAREISSFLMEEAACNNVDARRACAKADFEQQEARLLKMEYPEHIGMSPNGFLDGYIHPYWKLIDERGAFGKNLIIVSENFLSIPKKLSLLEWKGNRGKNYLDLSKLRNAEGVEIPQFPYVALDVEDGRAMKNISPDGCVAPFKKNSRLGFVANEGIMVVTYDLSVLEDHGIWCLGSRFGSFSVPGFCVSDALVVLLCPDSAPRTSAGAPPLAVVGWCLGLRNLGPLGFLFFGLWNLLKG